MNIHELINKYFEGETSSVEEQQIRSYFNSDNVSDDLKVYKPLFVYIDEEIEQLNGKKNYTQSQKKNVKRHRLLYYISTAACALIIIGIGLFHNNKQLPCIADGNYVIINGQCYSEANIVKSMAFEALMEVSTPASNYFPEKESINQREVMNSQLKELSKIFTE